VTEAHSILWKCGAQNASVCPSDEDSQTFYVNASNGDSFRLKGNFTLANFVL